MGILIAALLGQAAAAGPGVVDLSRGPVTTTNVAVTVSLDPEGRVVSCRGALTTCLNFRKGRVVAQPLRRNGRPVPGVMTVSTTTVVSAR